MTILYLVALAIALILAIYLFVALFRPEKFS